MLLFNVLQLVGIGVLLVMGIKLLTAKGTVITQHDKVISRSHWYAARDGFLIAFVNPKALVFFTAVFSQFLYQGMALIEKFGLVLVAFTADTLWYSLVVLLVIQSSWLDRFHKYAWMLDRLFGGLLIFYCIFFTQTIVSKFNFA